MPASQVAGSRPYVRTSWGAFGPGFIWVTPSGKTTVSHTTDAILAVTKVDHTTDAVILATTEIDHTTDAIVIRVLQHTTDAFLTEQVALGSETITIDLQVNSGTGGTQPEAVGNVGLQSLGLPRSFSNPSNRSGQYLTSNYRKPVRISKRRRPEA